MYSKEDVVNLFKAFVDEYLDSGIEDSGKEESMASKYRESYTFTDSDGERQQVRIYGKNKEETDLKFQVHCKTCASQNSKWKREMTFKDFVEEEYRPNYMVKPFIAETTLGKYDYCLRHYLYPEFGDKILSSITVNDVQQFRKKMAEASEHGYKKNLACKSIDDMTGFLNKIFKVAAAMKRIDTNPVQRPLLKKVGEESTHHKPMDAKTLDECKKRIPHIADERTRLYAAILFFNGGGMRPEEILGLKWENVHLDDGFAEIREAVTHAGADRHVVIKSTKTPNSVRDVLFPKILIDILRPYSKPSGYVLHGRDPQKPLAYSSWQRTYVKMQEELGIRGRYCNYDLRTTYATEMIEEGYSSAFTAKMMGHKDSRMVETVYAHTRHEGIEQMRGSLERKNAKYGSSVVPKNSEKPTV